MDHKTAMEILDQNRKLVEDVSKTQEEYCIAKQNYQKLVSDLERKHQTLSDDNKGLSEEISELEKNLSSLKLLHSSETKTLSAQQKIAVEKAHEMEMLAALKTQYSQRIAKASASASKKDLELLEKLKKKLEAYIKMTGVVWDFGSCDEHTISGYIQNSSDTKMKAFNVNIDGKKMEEISDEMWKLMKKYSST